MATISNLQLRVDPIQDNKCRSTNTNVKLFLCAVLAALSSIGGAAYAQPTFGNANDFVGTWRNIDNRTRDIKRIRITPHSGIVPLTVRVYGKCGNSECDWGDVNGYNGPAGSRTVKATIYSKTHQGYVFAERNLTLRLNDNGRMDYDMETDYIEHGDPRPNQVLRGTLNR